MYFTLSILGLIVTGQIVKSENGECTGFPSTPNQNLLFNDSLEVDPCGVTTKAVKCLNNETCTLTSLDPANCPYSIAVGQQPNSETIVLKVDLSVPSDGEFFVEVYPSKEDGEFNVSIILGHFEDTIYGNCSSYACCNSDDPTVRNVVRKCPTSVSETANKSLEYSYIWHAPTDYVGYVIFVGYFFKSNSEHWEQVTSEIIQLASEPDQISNGLSTTEPETINDTSENASSTDSTESTPISTTPEPEDSESRPSKLKSSKSPIDGSDEEESGPTPKKKKKSGDDHHHSRSKVELLGIDVGVL